jgi:hypothetical protein
MEMIILKAQNQIFHHPLTGEKLVCYVFFDVLENKSLIGSWRAEMENEPLIKDAKLEADWENYLDAINAHEDGVGEDDVDKFLLDYDNPNWIVFKNSDLPWERCWYGAIWTVIERNI